MKGFERCPTKNEDSRPSTTSLPCIRDHFQVWESCQDNRKEQPTTCWHIMPYMRWYGCRHFLCVRIEPKNTSRHTWRGPQWFEKEARYHKVFCSLLLINDLKSKVKKDMTAYLRGNAYQVCRMKTEIRYVAFSQRRTTRVAWRTPISWTDGLNPSMWWIHLLLNLVEVSDGTQGGIKGRARRAVKWRRPWPWRVPLGWERVGSWPVGFSCFLFYG